MRNVIISGGLAHDFPASSAALAVVLDTAGFTSSIRTDIDEALAALGDESPPALLTVNACRFAMTSEQRSRLGDHHLELSAAGRDGVRTHLSRGGGLLALHAACICFGEWAEWGEIVGARWEWGRSGHPPQGPVSVAFTASDHPLVAGLGDMELFDELYCDVPRAADVEPLAHGSTGELTAPVVWAREALGGRVFVDLLGHDSASIEHPTHSALLRRGAAWAAGGEPIDSLPRPATARPNREG